MRFIVNAKRSLLSAVVAVTVCPMYAVRTHTEIDRSGASGVLDWRANTIHRTMHRRWFVREVHLVHGVRHVH